MNPLRVALLHGEVPPDAAPDEQDVLVEVESVSAALRTLGHQPFAVPLSLQLGDALAALRALQPDLVFNLVESVAGIGRLLHLGPALLDTLAIPYTGGSTDAIYLTTNKVLTKQWLAACGVPTPPWLALEEAIAQGGLPFPGPYIVKAVWEEASIGLEDDSIVADAAELLTGLERLRRRLAGRGPLFVERYVDGREFNISLLEEEGEPRVLPQAEIRFVDFPPGKPRFVGYRAKWDEESFECRNTVRCFDFPPVDGPLLDRLAALSLRCWQACSVRGYCRVDFRVDAQGHPWVLELNVNPCISPDGGFAAAAARAGLSHAEFVGRIVEAALRR
ncbi:MAG: D-alanine--D-alanine ligase [Deltaproteobacteria bacterium]|nr:D-alanine--D-alanine ligase [Deltaproteobacteria bacterium]